MRTSEIIAKHREALLSIALRHGVSNVRIFGSAARLEDREGSDIDLLVDPSEGTSLFDLARIKREAEELTGVPCDVLTPMGVSRHFRTSVLQSARPL